MDKLSKEELLLVKEKFPDTLINKFYDEYFANDILNSLHDEVINQHNNGNRKASHNTTSPLSTPAESQINTIHCRNRLAENNLSQEELLLVKEKFPDNLINKFYDEYFANNIINSIKNEAISQHNNALISNQRVFRETTTPLSTLIVSQNGNRHNRSRFPEMNTPEYHYNQFSCLPNSSESFLMPLSDATNTSYQSCTHSLLNHSRNIKTRNLLCFKSSKKSIKLTVPSSKRQILEEEFRKEKYPSNEKLQKMSIKLNMRYDEVQNYFKKRRREEKETNHKFSNLVKLLDNYLEQED